MSSDGYEPLGPQGEAQAAEYLIAQGLKIIDRHFQTRWGEIDLIAKDGETIIFVEVKTRTRAWKPSAADAITPAKQKKLVSAALSYMKMRRLEERAMRFDAILIEGSHIDWLKDAFEPEDWYSY